MIKMGAWVVSSPTEFAHYGVKGMKWGVRNEKRAKGRSTIQKKIDSRVSREYLEATGVVKPKKNAKAVEANLSKTSKEYLEAIGAVKPKKNTTSSKVDYSKASREYLEAIGMLTPKSSSDDETSKVDYSKASKEYLEAIGMLDAEDTNDEELEVKNASKEYLEESKFNSQKNSIKSSTKLTDAKKDSKFKRGVEIVKNQLEKVGKAIAAAGKAAGKKAAELADKGKKALGKLLNIKPGKTKITSLDDMVKAEKTRRQKKEKNSKTIVYDYGAKEVRASPNASLSKVVKKLGGSTKGWKLQTN